MLKTSHFALFFEFPHINNMNDKNNIRKYKVLQTPTLIINDEYKCNYEKFDYSLLKRLVMFYS